MDKLTKLQKLLGDKKVVDTTKNESPRIYTTSTAMHVYEGTDSDSDTPRFADVVHQPAKPKAKSKNFNANKAPVNLGPKPMIRRSGNTATVKQYSLQRGEVAPETQLFCPWRAVKDYPFKFIGHGNRDKVLQAFYENEAYADEHWDFFFLHRGTTDLNQQPFILVPTEQVQLFFDTVNETLGINLTVPSGYANAGFRLQFDNDGNPRPRYLGKSTSSGMAQDLHRNIPPSYFKLDAEPQAAGAPSDRSLSAFKKKMDDMMMLQKHKKAATAEKRKKERFDKQKAWCHSLKRIQRYLGLRKLMEVDEVGISAELDLYGSRFRGDLEAAVKKAIAKLGPEAFFDAEKPAPYEAEADVVFVCVDVEAYERDSKLITEIGIATLDTRDLKDVVPGELGKEWMTKIRARHFRIKEHSYLNNTEFVAGCADRFDFGESEFISIKDAPRFIGSCFKHPFSNPKAADEVEEDEKRQIILLGHDTSADVAFMQKMGYDVSNLSNLREVADTASMWRYVKREPNPRSLGLILYELDLTGWNLHNAGNDAVYTLQAMIGIAIKHIVDKQNMDKEKVKKSRISDTIKGATEVALEKEEGWSSSGENSDGGPSTPPSAPPMRNHVPGTSKQAIHRANNPPPPRIAALSKPAPVAPAQVTQAPAALPIRSESSNWNNWMASRSSSTHPPPARQGVPSIVSPKSSASGGSNKSPSLQAGVGNMSYADRKVKEESSWDTYNGW